MNRYLPALMLVLALLSTTASGEEIRDYYAEPGLQPFKTSLRDLNESVDPFSGALQLNHTDITVPGNGGLNIDITRSYTHHQETYRAPSYMSLYGVGWTLHLGRIVIPSGSAGALCTGGVPGTLDNPSIEFPDGGRELLVLNLDGSGDYISKSNWRGRCDATSSYLVVTSPEGTRYTMDQLSVVNLTIETETSWYVSRIEDVHGNTIDIHYMTHAQGYLYLGSISASDGRAVDFSYKTDSNGCLKLDQISANGQSWRYGYSALDGYDPGYNFCGYNLTQVTMPDGRSWQYQYYPPDHSGAGAYSLQSITYPYGATVSYTYDEVAFDTNQSGGGETVLTTVVASKATSGPDITAATWTYAYAPASVPSKQVLFCGVTHTGYWDKTTVITPSAVQVYYHTGIWWTLSIRPDNSYCYVYWTPWQIGLLQRQETYALAALDDGDLSNDEPLEVLSFDWESRRISDDVYWHGRHVWMSNDDGTYAPVPSTQSIWRDDPGLNFGITTRYADYDSFGNPGKVTESSGYDSYGDRVTRRTYFIDTGRWIVNRLEDETIESVILCEADGIICNGAQVQNLSIDRSYNATGDLVAEDRFGVLTQYTYHPSGDLHTVTDARGNTVTHSNYKRGIAQSESYANSDATVLKTLSRVVNDTGTLASITDGRGLTTGFSYDDLNRISAIDYPIHTDVGIDWNVPGLRGRQLLRGDYRQEDYFDGFGQIIRTDRSGSGETITTTLSYDGVGRKTFASYPNSTDGTGYSYDGLGRLAKLTHPDGSTRSYAYALADRQVSETNERGHTTEYIYRAYGSQGQERALIQVNQPVSDSGADATTVINRNHLNQIVLLAQGEIRSDETLSGWARYFGYDSRTFLVAELHPEIGDKHYGRDVLGNLISSRTYTSAQSNYRYDDLNRLIAIDYPEGTPDVAYSYDGNDNLISAGKGDIRWDYEYDSNDNLTREMLTLTLPAASKREYVFDYTYDNLDNQATLSYPDGLVVDYAPDALGRPTRVGAFASAVHYHPNGHIQSVQLDNTQTINIDLDQRLFPVTMETLRNTTSVIHLSYRYDAAGNLLSIGDSVAAGNSITALDYDHMNRLTGATGPWGAGSFAYDKTGNLRNRTLGTLDLDYRYDEFNRLDTLSGSKSRSYVYDVYGNVVDNGEHTFLYDDASNLVDISGDGVAKGHDYDAHNQRTIRSDYNSGGRSYSVYDRAGRLMYEQQLESCRSSNYIRLGSLLIARQDRVDDESDRDADGMTDCIEDIVGLNPFDGADAAGDIDNDGLANVDEIEAGTDVLDPDSDSDGLSDGDEISIHGSNPLALDTDGDGLGDGFEISVGLNPLIVDDTGIDSDGDGLDYLAEYQAGTDVNDADSDGDGLSDGDEVLAYQTDPLSPDTDADGLNDFDEVQTFATVGNDADSDDDGLDDGLEVGWSLDPLDPLGDADHDGYSDAQEIFTARDPLDAGSSPTGGEVAWNHAATGEVRAPAAIAPEGTVYFGSEKGLLRALSLDGSLRWAYQIDAALDAAPAVAADGTIYVGADDGYLYAFSPDGALRGRYQTAAPVQSSPAIGHDGTVYVGADDGVLYAVNADGTLKWSYATGAAIHSSPAVNWTGTVVVGSDDGSVYAVNSDGLLDWSYATANAVKSSPAIGSDGVIYIGSDDSFLYALNPDGTLKWRYSTNGWVRSSPALGANGAVYAGSSDGNLYAFNSDGTPRWADFMAADITALTLGIDGTIYAGTFNNVFGVPGGELLAIVDDNGGPLAGDWPMFHRDRHHRGLQTLHNIAPIADAGADQSGESGAQLTLDAGASSDPDGSIVSYAWTQSAGPTVALSDPGSVTPSLTLPGVSSPTELVFQLTVTDNDGAGASDSATITAVPFNQPPVADAGADQTVIERANVELDASASSDTDGAIVGYAWLQTAGPGVTLSGYDTATPSFTAPSTSSQVQLSFTLTVSDDGGKSTSDSIVISVYDPNQDSDDDGLPDGWEQSHFGDLSENGSGDPDGDGLSNQQEYVEGSDPAIPEPPPAAVSGLFALPGDSSIVLSWPPVKGAAGYDLYWSNDPGVSPANGTLIANISRPYQHQGLLNGSSYYYVVAGRNNSGVGPASPQASTSPGVPAWSTPTMVASADTLDIALDARAKLIAVWSETPSGNAIWTQRHTLADGWEAALQINSGSSEKSSEPKVAMNDGGDAIAVWSQNDGLRNNLWASRYQANSNTWTPPEMIENYNGTYVSQGETGDVTADSVQVAINERADIAVIWLQEEAYFPPGGGSGKIIDRVRANRYVPERGWAGDKTIDLRDSGHSESLQVALNAAGQAVVAWNHYDCVSDGGLFCSAENDRVLVRRYDNGWSAIERVDHNDSDDRINHVSVAVSGSGRTQVVWERSHINNNRTDYEVWLSEYAPAAAAWSSPLRIALRSREDGFDPQVNSNSGDESIVAWREKSRLIAQTGEAGNAFGPAENISGNFAGISRFGTALGNDGSALAAWRYSADSAYWLAAARYVPGSGWQSPEGGINAAVSVSPRSGTFAFKGNGFGNGAIAWRDYNSNDYWLSRYAVPDNAPANLPPTADAGTDQTVDESTLVTLDGGASSDSDGSIVSYAWAQTAGPVVALSDAGSASASFAAPVVGSDTVFGFTLTVTDNDGAQASDAVAITVRSTGPDTTAPVTAATWTKYKSKGKTRFDVTLSVNEPASSYFRIVGEGQVIGGSNSSDWQAYTGAFTVELSSGPQANATLSFYSVDTANNQEAPSDVLLEK